MKGRLELDDEIWRLVEPEEELEDEWFEGLGEKGTTFATWSALFASEGTPLGKMIGAEGLLAPKLVPSELGEMAALAQFSMGTNEFVAELKTNGKRISGFVEMAM